jgi:hypothetical protein
MGLRNIKRWIKPTQDHVKWQALVLPAWNI